METADEAAGTEQFMFYGALDADGCPCLVKFDDSELADHPRLATDAAYRQGYLDHGEPIRRARAGP